jgi:hypothetical protein
MSSLEPLLITFQIFLIIFLVSLILVGTFLIIRAIQIKLFNLFVMGIAFLLVAIGFLDIILFQIGQFFEELFVATGFILVLVFTYLTFFSKQEENKRKWYLILFIGLLLYSIQLIFAYWKQMERNTLNFYLGQIFDTLFTFFIFGWLANSSYQAYKKLKEEDIVPWIKFRYKLLALFSGLLPFHVIPIFFIPWDVGFGDPTNLSSVFAFGLTACLALIFSIGYLIVWIMPDWFKSFIDRFYDYDSAREKDIEESELMDLIKRELKK